MVRVARISKVAQGGQVTERTTKKVVVEKKDGTKSTTTTTTEKHAAPQWVADAWMLERRCPDEFHYQRHEELMRLERQLKCLTVTPIRRVRPKQAVLLKT